MTAAMILAMALALPASTAIKPTPCEQGSCAVPTDDEVSLMQTTQSVLAEALQAIDDIDERADNHPLAKRAKKPEAKKAQAKKAQARWQAKKAEAKKAKARSSGWFFAAKSDNCDVTCGNEGLVCTKEQLMAHNGDVDTEAELNKLIEGVAGASTMNGVWQPALTCNSYSTGHGANLDVPTYNAGLCYVSSSSRPESSYSCASTGGGNRMCYCHEEAAGWCDVSWGSTDFCVCDYFGDPHFKKNYKQDSNFDLMGQGPFVAAGSKSDVFEVQNFQCPYGAYPQNTMTHGLAVRFDTNIVVLTVDGSKKPLMWLNGKTATEKDLNDAGIKTTGKFLTQVPGFQLMTEDCKYRIDNQYRDPSLISGVPHFVFDNLIRVPSDDCDFEKGMCSGCEYQMELSAEDLLFTDEQIGIICQHCQIGTPPKICTENYKPPTPVPAESSCAEIPHPCELPDGVAAGCDFDAAKAFCAHLEGTGCYDGCQFDYCAEGCDLKEPTGDECMPEPPPPNEEKVTGDPHVTNVRGERFDLRRLGVSELLRLPRHVAEGQQPLLTVLGRVETDRNCVETFIKQLDFGGGWLSQSGRLTLGTNGSGASADEAISLAVNGTTLDVNGLRTAEGLKDVLEVVKPKTRETKESTIRAQKTWRQTFLTVKMRFPQARLTVDWVHRRMAGSDVNHLNLKVASLPKPTQGMEVGGILGLDDHTTATIPSDECESILAATMPATLLSTGRHPGQLEGPEPAKAVATYEDEDA